MPLSFPHSARLTALISHYRLLMIIIKKECLSLFVSPLGWSILILGQIIIAYDFLQLIESYLQFQQQIAINEQGFGLNHWIIKPYIATLAMFYLLIIPVLVSRLLAWEEGQQTLLLFRLSQLSSTQTIVGKWLGLNIFLTATLFLFSLIPLTLALDAQIDKGQIFSGLFGISLFNLSITALLLFVSGFFRQFISACLTCYLTVALFWLFYWTIKRMDAEWLTHISGLHQLEPFMSGYFSLENLLFFIFSSTLFILLSIQRFEFRQLPH